MMEKKCSVDASFKPDWPNGDSQILLSDHMILHGIVNGGTKNNGHDASMPKVAISGKLEKEWLSSVDALKVIA